MQRGRALRGIVALTASIGLLIAVGVGPVAAEVTEDQAQEQAEWIDCAQPELSSEDCWNGLAQTVTVGITGQLTAIQIPIGRSVATDQALAVEIRAGGPTGSVLATSTPVAAGDIPVEDADGIDWVFFVFPSMPAVTAGDVIAIVIPFGTDLGTAAPLWWWGVQDGDPYAGGVAMEGVAPSDWAADPDWDFAFATYVAAGAPTCQVAAYQGEAELTQPVEIAVGQTFDILFFDFPPFSDVEVAFTPVVGDAQVEADVTDAFGETWWSWESLESEIGDWVFSATIVDTECQASLDVTIVAAPTPTPTPTATVVPTATPGGITLPPTSAAGETSAGDGSILPALGVLGVTLAALAVATRRLTPRTDRPRIGA